MAAARLGDRDALTQILRRQRSHLLRELRGLTEAAATAGRSPVDALLITAAERHVRADLEIVDAAEVTLGPDVLRALAVPAGITAEADEQAGTGGRADATGPAAARSGR